MEAAMRVVVTSDALLKAQNNFDGAAEDLDALLTDTTPFTLKVNGSLYTIEPLGNADFAISLVNILELNDPAPESRT